MHGHLRHLELDPDPASLPSDPDSFAFTARMIVGPANSVGEETFDLTVCSPEWLADACRGAGGIYSARHHLIVNVDKFDRRALEAWLAARVQDAQADSWSGIAEKIARLGYWEFEDYSP